MTKPHIFFKHIATLGPIGYLPASGTVATAITLPIVWWVRNNIVTLYYCIVFQLLFGLGMGIVEDALKFFDEHDPDAIVLDEICAFFVVFMLPFYARRGCGCRLTFLAFNMVPLDIIHLLVGFVLFRYFDIYKPLGIKSVEQLKGAKGVMLDDFLAAIYANVTLNWILPFLADLWITQYVYSYLLSFIR